MKTITVTIADDLYHKIVADATTQEETLSEAVQRGLYHADDDGIYDICNVRGI